MSKDPIIRESSKEKEVPEQVEQVQEKQPEQIPQKSESTDSDYKVKEGEEGYFHLLLERPRYDPTDGERLSEPFTQLFAPGDFAMQIAMDLGKPKIIALGYKVHKILHRPDEKTYSHIRVETSSKDEKFISMKQGIENFEAYLIASSVKRKRNVR